MPQQAQPTCASCHKTFGSHFVITRVRDDGTATGEVRVCSLICLINWGYNFSLHQGMQIASTVQSAIRQLVEAVKGPKQ